MVRTIKSIQAQIDALTRISGAAKEAQELHKLDARRRALASNIINPQEVKGDYDVGRVLMTTLGGDVRSITHDDLEQFRKNVKTVGSRLKKGLTAQKIIDLSRKEDRERANEQIKMAVPAGSNKGVIRFITNASKDSKVTRHHVTVELVNYDSAVASPTDVKKLAQWLVKDSPLKYDCDCGRHTFWYRYITTIGGFNAGRPETGYPKLKNPNLAGVACKHVLRVMHELSRNLMVRGFVAQMIDRGQQGAAKNSGVISKKKAEEIARQQRSRKREIVASDIKAKGKTKALKKLTTKNPALSSAKKKADDQALFDAMRSLRKLKESGHLSQKDFDLLIKTNKK